MAKSIRPIIQIETANNYFYSRQNPKDIRLGDWATNSNIFSFKKKFTSQDCVAIIGYSDDQGIKINHGRPGAKNAPNHIRKYLYRLTPNQNMLKQHLSIFDFGNMIPDFDITKTQVECIKTLKKLPKNLKRISLGGGHDYAYVDGTDFLLTEAKNLKKSPKPLIINLDAHLDVRKPEPSPHSGSAFYQLVTENAGKFDLIECGIQDHCNSPTHLDWAQRHGVHVFNRVDLHKSDFLSHLKKIVGKQKRKVFFSFDIDVLAASIAPGCSQSWESGLNMKEAMEIFQYFLTQHEVQVLGIYEVSPELDEQDRTSKLAALFIYEYLKHICKNTKK